LPDIFEPKESIRVKKNDLLLTRANGVADLVGKCVIVKEEPKRKLMMSDKLLRLNPNKKILRNFLLHSFNSSVIRKQIELCWGGSSGQKNIGQSDIKLFLLAIPSLDEQRIIGNAISEIDDFLIFKKTKLNHLHSIKKAAMQDLLTGEVRVTVN
jgi:type I restriction enzyme S subunit